MNDLGDWPDAFAPDQAIEVPPDDAPARKSPVHPSAARTTGMAGQRPRNLIVTGMHRSGTSFLTECLTAIGWGPPSDRGAPSFDNPRGHFEPAGLVALNTEILTELGSNWSRFSPLSRAETAHVLRSDYADRIDRVLARSFDGDTRRVIKDPRIALLSPLWRVWADQHQGDVAVAVALRKPRSVVRSLVARDGLSPDIAMLAWIAHSLGALDLIASIPGLIVPFPQWIESPERLLSRLQPMVPDPKYAAGRFHADVLRICLPDAIHAEGEQDEAASGNDQLTRLAEEIYATAYAWSEADSVPDADVVRAFRDRFDAVRHLASTVERHGQTWARDSAHRHAEATAALVRREEELAADIGRRVAENSAHASALAEMAECRAADRRQLSEALADIVALRDALSEMEDQRSDLAHRLDVSGQAVEALRTGLAAIETEKADAEAALRVERARSDRMATVLNTARARSGRLSRARHLLKESLIGTAERLHQSETDRRAQATALHAADAEAQQLRVEISALQSSADALTKALADTRHSAALENERLRQSLRAEELTIARPIYRRLYRYWGRQLRKVLNDGHISQLKRRLPGPGGIPAELVEAMPALPVPVGTNGTVGARQGDAPDIFVLSIINWDFRTQRPQHLARDWARRGHRVFYIEMESDLTGPRVRTLAPNLHVIRLGTPVHDLIPTYRGVADVRQIGAWVERLLHFCEGVGVSPSAHVVIQHPYWWPFARSLPGVFTLTFDCMDEISGFANTEAHVLDAERDMIARADHMIVSSQYLYDRHRVTRPVSLVRNAADCEHFLNDSAPSVPAWLASAMPEKRAGLQVGYVGAIAEWFDVSLIADAASLAPDMQFHLCGAVTNRDALSLRSLPNVTLHGEIPYADVPGFLAAMDVMTIPFRLLPIIQACDPVKFYEYAAAGKPVVATRMPELDRAGDLVARVATPAEFVNAVRDAAVSGNDAAHLTALRDYARANTWADRGVAALDAMMPTARVSVVILAFGDPTLTMTTVHSLTGNGLAHPALEIIVVDNGSPPEATASLRSFLADIPCARLIENERNLGFAGGNNVGIAAATGEYVLLLNNDTYVAPGAITSLVRHLQRDPEIGVVGPMTNNIGNEARIDIHYGNMAEMVRAAQTVTAGYRGQWTEIGVVAYFCAMFRRADLSAFGPLDEVFGLGMFEDDDHCARIRAKGYVCALAEDAFVHHHLSATFDLMGQDAKRALFQRNRAIFEARWGAWTPHRYRDDRPQRRMGVA